MVEVVDEATAVGLPTVGSDIYSFQLAPAPNEPPLTVNVSVVPAPEHTVPTELVTDEAAVEGKPTVQV